MRSLSASLLAAQRSASREPYVRVEVWERLPDVACPLLERLYAGGEPDLHHTATMPADGSLIRARVDSEGRLYVQRVPDPGPGSDFSMWTLLDYTYPATGIALCSRGSTVHLFFIDTGGYTIRQRVSDDCGASWGASSVVVSPPQMTRCVAGDISPNGTAGLFYVSSDQLLWATRRINGVWQPPLSWPHTGVVQFKGVACAYGSDWDIAVCGIPSGGGSKAWTAIYGDGGEQAAGTWSALREHSRASAGSGVEFKHPFLSKPDVFRLSYVEAYTGSVAYSRPVLSFTPPASTFSGNRWRDGVPFNLSCACGVALAHGAGGLWLSTPYGVWRGALDPTPLDLTGDVLSLSVREDLAGASGLMVLRGDSAAAALLHAGSQVRVSPGLVTSAGIEVSDGIVLWLDGWERQASGGRSVLRLTLSGGWSVLEGWRARGQLAWASGQATVREILASLLARAGFALDVLSASEALDAYAPDFTVHPAEDGATAVRRLMALVPDVLFFRGGAACVRHLQPSDPADYAYGTAHAIIEGRRAELAGAYNRVQAFGTGVTGEAFSWDEVEERYDRLLQVHDLNLDTAAKAQARAEALLHTPGRTATAELAVPVNCGQELYDVVEVTEPRLGLDAERYRVLGLELRYERERTPRYTHTLTLGGE